MRDRYVNSHFMWSFHQKKQKLLAAFLWHAHPGREGKNPMTTTTKEWIKEQEKVGWGEGREAVAAKTGLWSNWSHCEGGP